MTTWFIAWTTQFIRQTNQFIRPTNQFIRTDDPVHQMDDPVHQTDDAVSVGVEQRTGPRGLPFPCVWGGAVPCFQSHFERASARSPYMPVFVLVDSNFTYTDEPVRFIPQFPLSPSLQPNAYSVYTALFPATNNPPALLGSCILEPYTGSPSNADHPSRT